MSLMLHAGGYSASLADITNVVTPKPTATHVPISHRYFLEQVLEALAYHGYTVTDQKHGLMGKAGEDYFGVITLDRVSPTGDFTHVLGLRNSHRHRFAAQAALGSRVFVCDNLAFRASDAVVKFSRKHTTFILRDFPRLCIDKVAELPGYFADTERQIDRWKTTILGTEPVEVRRTAADLCMTALTKGATNGRLLPRVWHEFNREDGPGGHNSLKGSNLWSLFNAFTEVEKTTDSPAESQRRTARLSTMLDGICHAIDDAREDEIEDRYWSGTGELINDESYERFLNT
jgi:hypothetical protein